ncbi:cache domain-containing protein [Streptomyces lunaelactis]|uniref:cache domain-containing protein n=1 Tax=Streptomyces lunaelactis TaxID=1535768 RepID=UPI0015859047|nr:HAMP domain-containing protein [Streptomyces lunaelactis]NUK05947.1 cache and HAMP domain-containing protein [Streptomyces lunaelactis]NUK18399.1 cache and HAMP domain-containing protein [Streptomyces lunaelactis]NUK61950.1 cache and HAMP domain-containing protein [Streptomyces lunaelactis]
MSLLGGIRPPIAMLSVLLLCIAALTAFQLGRAGEDPVPEAVSTSQQHFAEDGAIALRASLDASITDLSRTAAMFNAGDPVSADTVLDKLSSIYQKWRGTAVIEIKSGRLEAQRGENLPLTAVDRTKLGDEDGLSPRMVRLEHGGTRLLTFAVLSWPDRPQQLLIASSSLKFPGVSLGDDRAIAVVDSSGQVLSSDGLPNPGRGASAKAKADATRTGKDLAAFAETAAGKARQHPLKSKAPGSGGFPGVSGSLLGDAHETERPVAGYAALTGPVPGEGTESTGLGLTVVSLVDVPENGSAALDSFFWISAAGALLLIGALAVALLIGTVQRPLLQLFLESRRLSRGDLTRPVTQPKYGEASRVGAVLERLRRQLLSEPAQDQELPETRRGRRGRIGMRALVAVCGVLLLVWSAPLVLLLNRAGDSVSVPKSIVHDQRERTDTLADRVRRALNEGHADLTLVASLLNGRTTPAAMTEALEQTRTQHPHYTSIYVLGADGTIVAESGSEPRHPRGKGPSAEPVVLLGEGGNEPVIVEYAKASGLKGAAVVGELRIGYLNALLKRPGLGQIRVVDEKHRVIGANSGYLAFEKLPGKIDALVTKANQKASGKNSKDSKDGGEDADNSRPSARVIRSGGVTIAAAAAFDGGGAAGPLRWTVVSWQPAKGLAIPAYDAQNRTVLAGLLGLTAATACLGWLHIIVVRPLRELAQRAEALADGDRRTVMYPRHHDEVGAVTRSLEVIRQQLHEQRKRDVGGSAGRSGSSTPVGRT